MGKRFRRWFGRPRPEPVVEPPPVEPPEPEPVSITDQDREKRDPRERTVLRISAYLDRAERVARVRLEAEPRP